MRIAIIIFNIIIISIIAFLGIIYYTFNTYEAPSNTTKNINFIVQKGEGLNTILNRLKKYKIVNSIYSVKLFIYFNDSEKNIKAGEYQFPAQISPKKAISMMINGDTITHKITLIEGKTVYNALKKIKNHTALSGNITITPPEGTLMADTYLFERDMTRDDLIKLMQKQQYQFLMNEWEERAKDLPIKTPAEALILASIVEKETGISSERNLVASVFVNRLRKKMRLQSDPTIIYGITKGKDSLKRPIYKSDIINEQDGYNTYVINSLPPTPICNPSKEAIHSVLHPAKTNYLFFVADGTGGHAFASNLKAHNDNVKKWRQIEKNLKTK